MTLKQKFEALKRALSDYDRLCDLNMEEYRKLLHNADIKMLSVVEGHYAAQKYEQMEMFIERVKRLFPNP